MYGRFSSKELVILHVLWVDSLQIISLVIKVPVIFSKVKTWLQFLINRIFGLWSVIIKEQQNVTKLKPTLISARHLSEHCLSHRN